MQMLALMFFSLREFRVLLATRTRRRNEKEEEEELEEENRICSQSKRAESRAEEKRREENRKRVRASIFLTFVGSLGAANKFCFPASELTVRR